MCSADNGHFSVVVHLLALKADPSLQSRSGDTALLQATKGGHLSVVKALVRAGADVNHVGHRTQQSAVRLAAAQARWDLVEYLVSEGAAVDGVDAEGRSLCHYEVPPALHGGGALAAAVQRGIVSRFNKLIQRPMARLRGPHRPLSAFHRERLQNAEQRSAAPAAHTGDAAARRSIAVRESDGEGADDSSSGSDSGAVSGDETSSASSNDSARPSAVSGVPSAAASAASPSSVGRDATVLSAEESLDEDALLQDAEQTVRLVKQRSERAAQRRRGAGLALQSEQSEARGASDDNDDGGSEGDSPHQHADVSGAALCLERTKRRKTPTSTPSDRPLTRTRLQLRARMNAGPQRDRLRCQDRAEPEHLTWTWTRASTTTRSSCPSSGAERSRAERLRSAPQTRARSACTCRLPRHPCGLRLRMRPRGLRAPATRMRSRPRRPPLCCPSACRAPRRS